MFKKITNYTISSISILIGLFFIITSMKLLIELVIFFIAVLPKINTMLLALDKNFQFFAIFLVLYVSCNILNGTFDIGYKIGKFGYNLLITYYKKNKSE